MADGTDGGGATDRAAAAEYLASMTADLAAIAREHGLAALAYLLELARLEAENARSGSNGPQ